jgi:hypothetical protein
VYMYTRESLHRGAGYSSSSTCLPPGLTGTLRRCGKSEGGGIWDSIIEGRRSEVPVITDLFTEKDTNKMWGHQCCNPNSCAEQSMHCKA